MDWVTPFLFRFSIANGNSVLKDQVTRPNYMDCRTSPLAKISQFQVGWSQHRDVAALVRQPRIAPAQKGEWEVT